MTKPKASLRKPPTSTSVTPTPAKVDAFVNGGTSRLPEVQTAKRSQRERRQVTLYLPPELAQKLKIFSVTRGREMSEVVEAALLEYLPSE
jgi:hypothetical protein